MGAAANYRLRRENFVLRNNYLWLSPLCDDKSFAFKSNRFNDDDDDDFLPMENASVNLIEEIDRLTFNSPISETTK